MIALSLKPDLPYVFLMPMARRTPAAALFGDDRFRPRYPGGDAIDPRHGMLSGGSDPRSDGAAIGY